MHPGTPLILRVSRIPGFGVSAYWKLCDAFGSLERAVQQSRSAIQDVVSPALAEQILASLDASQNAYVEKTLAWCHEHSVTILNHLDPSYPVRLREIKRAPPLIYVRGDADALNKQQLAIVGSRKASHAGRANARAIAQDLAQAGLAITSGLALGIDAEAHLGALEGKGATIAVIGNGIDRIYPHRNRGLAEAIVDGGGAIVSEFPLGTKPSAQNFPRRNRIISGLSVGTLVVEAAIKSGSLISARYALEQNREIFAMPGSIHNPLSRGCHLLIKQGAVLVEEADDILNELEGFVALRSAHAQATLPLALDLSQDEKALLGFLEHDPCCLDTLAERSGLPVERLLANLMSLELMGLVSHDAGAYVLNAGQLTSTA